MQYTLLLMASLSLLAPGAIAEPIVVQQTAAAPRTVDRIDDEATAARLAREGRGLSAQQVSHQGCRIGVDSRRAPAPHPLADRASP